MRDATTTTRTTFGRRDLLAFGSAVTLIGVPLLQSLADAAATMSPADADALNAAIALERAGINAYSAAAATGLVTPPVLALAQRFSADHTAHRDALIGALRVAGARVSDAVAPIAVPPLKSERDIIEFAQVVEMKAASTYLSVIPDLQDRKLAGVAASILGVETTHVALLGQALGTRVYASGFVA